MLCYQDFKDTFVCNTQLWQGIESVAWCCVIRISKILLYAIHNLHHQDGSSSALCYQDFKDTFVCNTQPFRLTYIIQSCCVIRISKILLYAIHNVTSVARPDNTVVLSGFQRYFCMQYTTPQPTLKKCFKLCYQDFKDTFVCNTQPRPSCSPALLVVLSGFQRYFCMQYTTLVCKIKIFLKLCYQDFKDTFVCNTQRRNILFIVLYVVLSGFQRYFCMQYTTLN